MKLPELNITPAELFNLQYGTIRSWVLVNAVEFKLFNHTVEKKTSQEISCTLKTHEANTELFLNALSSLGLLKKEDGKYINTELSETFLVEGRETYIGQILLMNEDWNLQSRAQMKELIESGPMLPQEAPEYTGDYFANYVRAMGNLARSSLSAHSGKY